MENIGNRLELHEYWFFEKKRFLKKKKSAFFTRNGCLLFIYFFLNFLKKNVIEYDYFDIKIFTMLLDTMFIRYLNIVYWRSEKKQPSFFKHNSVMVQDRVKCLITKIVLILMLFVKKFPKEIQKLKNTEIFNSIYSHYILYIYINFH